MESLISMEYLLSLDSILALLGGAVIGLVFTQFIKGWGIGLVGNSLIGLVGGLLAGGIFNGLDLIDIGDFADPIAAGLIGGLVFVGVAGLLKR